MAERCGGQMRAKMAVREARVTGMLVWPRKGYMAMDEHCSLYAHIKAAVLGGLLDHTVHICCR